MKINPNGDGTDFMANRHLREAKAEVEKLELMEEDFDVTAALAAVQPKTSNNKSTGRGKEVADEDESLETSSEDDVGDHGSDLDDFINDASEDEEEAAHSDEAEAEAEETETESETEESTIDKSAKRAKMAIVASDNEETGTPIPKKTLTFASDEEEATETNTARSATQSSKPKNNAIIFSDDE